MPGRTFTALIRRLEREFGFVFDGDVLCRSHRPGYWQRSAGAFSWSIYVLPVKEYAGYEPIKKLLSAKKLQIEYGGYGETATIITSAD